METVQTRFDRLGIRLPSVPDPSGGFVPARLVGDMLYLSGTIGTVYGEDGRWSLPLKRKLGRELSVEQDDQSARWCALNHLAAGAQALGTLDRVAQVVRLVGYVNAAPGFTKAPLVLDGASDLLIKVFGPEIGSHARTAVYQNEMSFNAPIETELLVQVASRGLIAGGRVGLRAP